MAIPKYFEMYRTFLDCLKDGKVHTTKEMKNAVINAFNLSEDDVAEMLPSGKQRVFENRIGWCRTYLKKADLITSPARGQFAITERGLQVLSQEGEINDNTLMQFPQFVKFKKGEYVQADLNKTQEEKIKEENTPQEVLENSYEELNNA
ncbi:MAG: winged helix-turn-helix domain-containing protein, partial [Lachnospiraceae bacterium]|nr:winged helix-turn-helix domain-containing protein [Lachnospiraceae bacterium]